MTVPQLDFILECFSKDNPEKYTFVRPGVEVVAPPSQAQATWFNVLRGKALEAFMFGRINHAAVAAKRAKAKVFGVRGKGVI